MSMHVLERTGRSARLDALTTLRLSAGGALVGLSAGAAASMLTGGDRMVLEWVGGVVGFAIAMGLLQAFGAARNR